MQPVLKTISELGPLSVKTLKPVLKPLTFAILASGFVASNAMAYEAGDWVVRAGATMVDPQESGDPLELNGTVLTDPLNGELGVDSDTQLGLTLEYMLTDNWGIELLAATPFSHTATVTNASALQGLDTADIKHLPPTLMFVYHFNTGSRLNPYIGAGINYTVFFDEDLTSKADAAFAGLGLTGGDVELDDSWGASFQAGVDYHLNDKWLLNASMRWIDIDTEAEITFDSGDKVSAGVEVDPFVYTLSVGYRF